MLSNLATYIFGASNNEETETNPSINPHNVASPPAAPKPPAPLSEGEEDWVVVEERPSHLTLGSLNESTPAPPGGSTGSSHTPSESGSEGGAPPNPPAQQLSRTDRRLATPFGSCSAATTLAAVKAVRSAQKSKDKSKAKSLTSKALERRNKAVKSNQSKKQYHASLNLRPANGKQLKQC